MAGNYSLKGFLRLAPNKLLDGYFKAKGISLGIDFDQLKETAIDPVADALETMPTERSAIEMDFIDIFRMANLSGFKAIQQEYQSVGATPWPVENKQPDKKELLMVAFSTFLTAREIFDSALRFQPYFNSTGRYWRKLKDLPANFPADTKSLCPAFGGMLKLYFRTEGRGWNCHVDYYHRGSKHFFFAYPEDHAQAIIEYIGDDFQRNVVNPAFDVILVYDEKEGSLESYYEGSVPASREINGIFLKAALDLELPEDYYNKPVYPLDKLKNQKFQFVTKPEHGIDKILVRKLRFDVLGVQRGRVTIEAQVDGASGQAALYEQIGRVFSPGLESVDGRTPIAVTRVSQAEIAVDFKAINRKGYKRTTFSISTPNSCSLKHTPEADIIREILLASGLEHKSEHEQADRQAA